jgi:hypothetical protein
MVHKHAEKPVIIDPVHVVVRLSFSASRAVRQWLPDGDAPDRQYLRHFGRKGML